MKLKINETAGFRSQKLKNLICIFIKNGVTDSATIIQSINQMSNEFPDTQEIADAINELVAEGKVSTS